MATAGQINGETIKSAIALKIRSAFASTNGSPPTTSYPTIYKEKVLQGMKKPCFFVWTMDVSPKKLMNNNYEFVHQMNIRFEPDDDDEEAYKTCMENAIVLTEALSKIDVPIEIDGDEVLKQIYGRNISYKIVEDVLQFYVTYTLRGYIPDTIIPVNMENILQNVIIIW